MPAGKIAILMGSPNDRDKMKPAETMCRNFGVACESFVMSAHRTPGDVADFCRMARRYGFHAIITAAGMSNGLTGAAAAHSRLPVFGVPLSGGNAVHDLASFLSTSELPPGIPAGGVAIDGAANAALLAIRQLAVHDSVLDRKMRGFMERGSNVKAPMPFHTGKVRDTFRFDDDHPDLWVQWTSDRMSAFDWVLDDPIPGKGEVLTSLTKMWLRKVLDGIMPNHLVYSGELPAWARPLASQITVVRRLDMVPVEAIVRGYLEGSAWREYQQSGTVHGQPMPSGMIRCQKLPEPIFTPSTKAAEGDHDENIDFDRAVEIVGLDTATEVRGWSLELYAAAQAYAAERGIIILDTKFEFGRDPETGQLVLADEVFTPDSSRFVDAETFEEGKPPQSMDKEYLRRWLADKSGWDKDSHDPPPPLPSHVIAETAHRYQVIADRLSA